MVDSTRLISVSRSEPVPGGGGGSEGELPDVRPSGRSTRNVEPLPIVLSTPIVPPCAVTICRQIGRPRPVPLGLFVSVSPTCLNFSNTASRVSQP